MSIEGHSTAPGANVIAEHHCCVAGCAKWGGLGFAPSKTVETHWWCAHHYPFWNRIKDISSGSDR
ncbi:hypothetical protein GGD53_005048 [Rhizobium aethiopicum]|uniref:Uncharacterized protein n=1 Tax=Rhizobium aethiopicum TaxID=1138170 RepID=A0A7W6VRS1_9HYPH|nr:hypothetical protein [Rhizobium aethiopicum]MBB4194865.1 hypothetical protein [Rhizobium aethiopicum]